MVSVDEMSCKATSLDGDCNTFSFSSITPKVMVSEKTKLINGAVMNLTLSGIDLVDVKDEGTADDPKYYVYVETWDNMDMAGRLDVVVRPTIKVEINKDNPTKTVSAMIDGLKEFNDNKKRRFCALHDFRLIEIPYTDENLISYDYIMNLAGY